MAVAIAVVVPIAMTAAIKGIAFTAVTTGTMKGLAIGTKLTMGAVAGGLSGFVATGSVKGAFAGAVTGMAFAAVGHFTMGMKIGGLPKALIKGATGGTLSELQGGRFKGGFIGAMVGELTTPAILGAPGGRFGQTVAAGIAGGAASDLAGGSFTDGAVNAAAGYAFNQAISGGFAQKSEMSTWDRIVDGAERFWGGVKWLASGIRVGPYVSFKAFNLGAEVNLFSVNPFAPNPAPGVQMQQGFDILGFGLERQGTNFNFRQDPSSLVSPANEDWGSRVPQLAVADCPIGVNRA